MPFNKIREFFLQKTVLVIGKYSSEPISGISKNFEILTDELENRKISFATVKIKSRLNGAIGSYQLVHSLKILMIVLACWVKIPLCKNVCLQVALSKNGFFRDFLIIWPAALFGKKVIIRVHSGGYGDFYDRQSKFIKFLIKQTLAQTYKIVVLGESLRNQFYFSSKLRDKTVVIPNGIDIAGRKDIISSKNYKNNECFQILYLSNMINSKGYLDLLVACRLLLQEGITNFFCNFCGKFRAVADEGNYQSPVARENEFEQLIKEWGLENHAAFHGPVAGSAKFYFLESANVFVLPTNYIWEGQPLSIIEAMSFAVPVISTAFRAIPDLIKDGYNGIFVDYAQPVQIKDAIVKMKNNRSFYEYLSKNALSQYKENFTQKKHLDLLIPLITQ